MFMSSFFSVWMSVVAEERTFRYTGIYETAIQKAFAIWLGTGSWTGMRCHCVPVRGQIYTAVICFFGGFTGE